MFAYVEEAFDRSFRFMPVKPWLSRLWWRYLLSIVFQVPAMFARFLLALSCPWLLSKFLAVAVLFIHLFIGDEAGAVLAFPLILAGSLTEGILSSSAVLVAFVFGPVVWSASAFLFPGSGWFWHRQVGAYEPSGDEKERIWALIGQLPEEAQRLISTLEIVVIDSPAFFAFARGRTMAFSRGLLESHYASPVLVHEGGHFATMDARFVQALDRLGWWGEPLRKRRERLEELNATRPVGHRSRGWRIWLYSLPESWIFRLAGGRMILESDKFEALWAPAWRKGEELADAYAVRAGQGIPLSRYMTDQKVPRDKPNPRGPLNHCTEPRSAERAFDLTQMATGRCPERLEELAHAMAWMA